VELRQDDVEPDEGCYVDQERLQLVGCVLVGDAFGQGVGFLAVVYIWICLWINPGKFVVAIFLPIVQAPLHISSILES
jgi:hypothetical protein